MSKIYITFHRQPTLELSIQDTELGHRYYNLVKTNYQQQQPIFRDTAKYTLDYLRTLVKQASEILGWDWTRDFYDTATATELHKDIEQLLGRDGFGAVSESADDLLHEIHYCLHLNQTPRRKPRHGWLQIEWYNDQGFALPEDFTFTKSMKFGDLKLQNPYVGHSPLQVYLEKDTTATSQTCKLHDFVRPGINIIIEPVNCVVPNEKILEFLTTHGSEFVNKHGIDKINRFIGYPVVGCVENIVDLANVVKAPILELDSLEFDE